MLWGSTHAAMAADCACRSPDDTFLLYRHRVIARMPIRMHVCGRTHTPGADEGPLRALPGDLPVRLRRRRRAEILPSATTSAAAACTAIATARP